MHKERLHRAELKEEPYFEPSYIAKEKDRDVSRARIAFIFFVSPVADKGQQTVGTQQTLGT